MRRMLLGMGAAVAAALVLCGCLVPEGPATRLDGSPTAFRDFPDPAGVLYATGVAQLYATSADSENVPSEEWQLGAATSTVQHDALGNIAVDYNLHPNGEWAPTVHYVGGKYVMWFAALQSSSPACLSTAYSSGVTVFSATNQIFCAPSGSGEGYLDPSFFVSTDGSLWLIWSVQYVVGGSNESFLAAQQLASNGLGFLAGSSMIDLATYTDVQNEACLAPSCLVNGVSYGLGLHPEIENPQLAIDPDPTVYDGSSGPVTYQIDVLSSVGTYSTGSSPYGYHTLEFACISLTSGTTNANCVWNEAEDISSTILGNNVMSPVNPGGLSLIDGSTGWAVWAGALPNTYQPRGAFSETTHAVYRNPPVAPGLDVFSAAPRRPPAQFKR
jgi:hypothetical protein